jgi:hypothetical protein
MFLVFIFVQAWEINRAKLNVQKHMHRYIDSMVSWMKF